MALFEEMCRRFDEERRSRDADVLAYREFVAQFERQISEIPETAKDDAVAIEHRQEGNRAYHGKRFEEALRCYNQSLCFAEKSSEQLGIGYANRSAVYFEMGEYEFALYNIGLARKHGYPEGKRPKLLTREAKCQERIAGGHSKGTVPDGVMDINVEVNPKIPFMATGITMKQYEGMGRGLVAEREFNTGDVILDEQIDLCFVSFERTLTNCAHCGADFRSSLIPCTGCVAFMYCSEKCRSEDQRASHWFECNVVTKLRYVTRTNWMIMGRLFFYGLTAFQDKFHEMINYCTFHTNFGSIPLDLNLTDSVNIFKSFYSSKIDCTPTEDHHLKMSAAAFCLVYLMNPQVTAFIKTEARRNFMHLCMLTLGRVSANLLLNREKDHDGWLAVLSPVASLMNHSCDPNACLAIVSGKIKAIVLRPIAQGDQLTVCYTSSWWSANKSSKLHFLCMCVVCGPDGDKWREAYRRERLISTVTKHEMFHGGGETTELGKYRRRVDILARQGQHPGVIFRCAVKFYLDKLTEVLSEENRKRERGRASCP